MDREFFCVRNTASGDGPFRLVVTDDKWSKLVSVYDPIEEHIPTGDSGWGPYNMSRAFTKDDECLGFWTRVDNYNCVQTELICHSCRHPVDTVDWNASAKVPFISSDSAFADPDVHVMLYHEVKYHRCSEVVIDGQRVSADLLRSAWHLFSSSSV